MSGKTVLIDCDAGPDDAWALCMAIVGKRDSSIALNIVGITCTQGNTEVGNVAMNVTRMLQALGETSIPVYKGAEKSLVTKFDQGDNPYFGQDGFGDVFPPIPALVEHEHAVEAIISKAEQFKGELTIVALGPLTNLALAVRLRPDIKTMIKEIYILGGNINATGNASYNAEFNFFVDPEAASVVLEEFAEACPMILVPWETGLSFAPSLNFRIDNIGAFKTPQVEMLNAAEAKVLEDMKPSGKYVISDQTVMAIVLDPTIITKQTDYFCTVETAGKYSRGLMVVDKFMGEVAKNVTVVEAVAVIKIERLLIRAAGGSL